MVLLSACSQSEQNQSNQKREAETKKNAESSKAKSDESMTAKPEVLDLPVATFAFQTDGDQIIPENCVWTDDSQAEGKYYWAVLLSNEINGKSKFTKEELQTEKVKIGKATKNCSGGSEDEQQKYAYEIDREGDLVNFLALKNDRMIQNADHTYSIDLNKNGTPEKIYVCYNMESFDAFFIERSIDHPYLKRVNVQLSYGIDGEIEEDISCGDKFYKKSGIIAKENKQTGEFSYSVK